MNVICHEDTKKNLVDSYQAFSKHIEHGGYAGEIMLAARELMRWIPVFDA